LEFKEYVYAEFHKVLTVIHLLSKGSSNILENESKFCKPRFVTRIGKLEEQVKLLQNENKSLAIVNEMLHQEILRIQRGKNRNNDVIDFTCPKKYARSNLGSRKDTNPSTLETSNRYATLMLDDNKRYSKKKMEAQS